MRKVIGVVSEGPTDFLVLTAIVNRITGAENIFRSIQPEPDMLGRYGNGWKGVWKWCLDNGDNLESFFSDITPALDAIIIQMDGDVSRKEKEAHCWCTSTVCADKGKVSPLECVRVESNDCPVKLPCYDHAQTPSGKQDHLETLIRSLLGEKTLKQNVIITIPCDSTEAWIVAAYQPDLEAEEIEDPWHSVIAKKKSYYGIRIRGDKKHISTYSLLVPQVAEQWENVVHRCTNARIFDQKIRTALQIR